MSVSTIVEQSWLKRLAPGTLLHNKNNPEWGFWLVYHAEVQILPGPWYQLHVWVLGLDRLHELSMESGDFQQRWKIIDVNA